MLDPPKIELSDSFFNTLDTRVEDILVNGFVNNWDIEQNTIDQIRGKYNFDEIKDAFENAAVPHQLELFLWQRQQKICKGMQFFIPKRRQQWVYILFVLRNWTKNNGKQQFVYTHWQRGHFFIKTTQTKIFIAFCSPSKIYQSKLDQKGSFITIALRNISKTTSLLSW